MSTQPKGFLLSRIISGLIALKFEGKNYFFKHPSPKLLYKADLLEQELIENNKNLMTFAESVSLLTDMGKWSDDKEAQINEQIPKILEELKIEVYLAFTKNPDDIHNVKEKLKKTKDYLFKLLSFKHEFDSYTIEGFAKKARDVYLIKKGIKGLDIKPELLLSSFYSSCISEVEIRRLVNSPDWQSKWVSMKNGCKIFSGFLSEEQEKLVKWSTTFDNLMEMEKPPSVEVFEDEDALDGFFLYKRIENNDKSILAEIEEKYARKGIKYTELYLPAKDMEQARRNDSLNTESARRAKTARFKQIEAQGVVDVRDLKDQRLQLDIMRNQLEMGAR